MKKILFIFVAAIAVCSCKFEDKNKKENLAENTIKTIKSDSIPMVNGFNFPVGKPNANGYYNAQKFKENKHLGEDWNGVNGGNTDLGDPIYAIANGYVSFAENIEGGWGNVIRVVHSVDKEKQIESVYAHCLKIEVQKGELVNKGDKIGTIGNNNGQYLAHLHLELRSEVGLPIGGGYSDNTKGYLNPTEYIKNHRK